MADNDSTKSSAEASGQSPEYYEGEMKALIKDIEDDLLTDDSAWDALRITMDGWREEFIKKSRTVVTLRDILVKNGVFIGKARPGATVASTVLKVAEEDEMPRWTKEMADATTRFGLIRTTEPDLQALLGRDRVDPRFWLESFATARARFAPSTVPTSVIISALKWLFSTKW
ncbi:MAG: hypothetical protein SEPTF4163_006375 [Sporothrix epigloea]